MATRCKIMWSLKMWIINGDYMMTEEMIRFTEKVCPNCNRQYDCDCFWDENNVVECMKEHGDD